MKKLLLLLFIVVTVLPGAYSQGLHIDSTRFITGEKCCTRIIYSIPTADKGILFVGSATSNPGGIVPPFPLDTGGHGNVLIGKIDSDQKISWIKVYGGSSEDYASSACETPDGGYAVLAQTLSTDGDITGYRGSGDIWLLRIDASGNLVWERTFGSAESDVSVSISNTRDHGFVILGATTGFDGDVPFHYGGMLSEDWLVIKTDTFGNKEWSKTIGGSGDESDLGSVLAVDSNYYIIGSTDSKDHDCADTAWHTGVPSSDDYHVLKLDWTGNVLWDSSYGGSGYDDVSMGMFDARDSTIMVTGSTTSNDFMVTGYQGKRDVWVVKVNKSGTLLWQKVSGSSGNEENGKSICASYGGGYVVYASTHPGTIGGSDASLFVLDYSGKETGSKIFGGTGDEIPCAIVPYFDGFAATGVSSSVVFTQGSTYGSLSSGGSYISYFGSGTVSLKTPDNGHSPLIIYPNPSKGHVTIILPCDEAGKLFIFNSLGQIIYEQEILNGSQYIDLDVGNRINGVYLVEWAGVDGLLQSAKLIKR